MQWKNKIYLIMSVLLLLSVYAFAATSTTATVHFVVPSSYDFTIAYDANISAATFYFVEADINGDTVRDGNGDSFLPYAEATATNLGQQKDANLFSIKITGTSTADVNAYWDSTLPSGVTSKISLAAATKGCGDDMNINAGWEETCSVTAINSPPTATTCKSITGTDTAGVVIANSVGSGATQGFCMWADFLSVAVGDVSRTLNIKSGAD